MFLLFNLSLSQRVFTRKQKVDFEKNFNQRYKSEIRQKLALELKSANTYRAHHLITLHV
jgi:hypothetical protein